MGIKHSTTKASGNRGYASEWNEDHIWQPLQNTAGDGYVVDGSSITTGNCIKFITSNTQTTGSVFKIDLKNSFDKNWWEHLREAVIFNIVDSANVPVNTEDLIKIKFGHFLDVTVPAIIFDFFGDDYAYIYYSGADYGAGLALHEIRAPSGYLYITSPVRCSGLYDDYKPVMINNTGNRKVASAIYPSTFYTMNDGVATRFGWAHNQGFSSRVEQAQVEVDTAGWPRYLGCMIVPGTSQIVRACVWNNSGSAQDVRVHFIVLGA